MHVHLKYKWIFALYIYEHIFLILFLLINMHINFIFYVNFFLMLFHFKREKERNFLSAFHVYLKKYCKGNNNNNQQFQKKLNKFFSDSNLHKDICQEFLETDYSNKNNKEKYSILSSKLQLNSGNKSGTDKNTINDLENNTMTPHISRLNELRTVMKRNNVDVYVLMNNDEHNSEIINDKDKKILYLTNYSGSDGTLVITQSEAILYVNPLYELQASNEIDHTIYTMITSKLYKKDELYEIISSFQFDTIAMDGKCTSVSFFENLKRVLRHKNENKKIVEKLIYSDEFSDVKKDGETNLLILENSLVEVKDFKTNTKKVFVHDVKFNGSTVAEKISKTKQFFTMENKNVNNLLISGLDDIAYVLNLRGYDYETSPVFYSYLLFQFNRKDNEYDKIILFTIIDNLTLEVKDHLKKNNIIIKDYNHIIEYLEKNVSTKGKIENINSDNNKTNLNLVGNTDENSDNITYDISLNPNINLIIYKLFDKKKILLIKSPIIDMKAIKNDVEIENIKVAHILDALALLQFFHWLDKKTKSKEIFNETEISLKNKVDYFRSTKKNFLFTSFGTISAIGSNAAVIHYEPNESTNSKITPSIYLLDSGGQYLHGTTDVTRTTHLGDPTKEEKEAYTLVLKGHLHLRKVIFTSYTNSSALDFVARSYLHKNYMDYNHGTGHGVGLALNVHEAGCSITQGVGSRLKKNMVLSNEPGYYLENKFGVRIENMQYVIIKKKTDKLEYLSFEDLTLYPYEKKLLDFSLLTSEEINDINEYHDTIRKTLLPLLKENPSEYDEGIINYLIEITEPISIH